jgi:hypothetical protein
MTLMIEIGQSSNPLLTFGPIILMTFSGYACGRIISSIRGKVTREYLRDLIYGNVILIFIFLAGFIIFGEIASSANEYFTVFTFISLVLSIFGIYLSIRKLITYIIGRSRTESVTGNIAMIKSSKLFFYQTQNVPYIFFGISLFVAILVYHAVIIYYHPIFSEYDSLYLFLPISKSILLGNGLNHDFYLGSDVNMVYPPFTQAVNSWLIHSFDYSSVRLFPIYYISLASAFVYLLTRNVFAKISNIKESSFLGLIASSAFLVTPALLVVSSRFSLQQDLAFLFVLTASFYFLSDIIRYPKPSKTGLLMLSVTLAIMALTREIGLVISTAIFFLVPAIKFTGNNLKLRAFFTILSFVPLYLYYFVFYGAVEVASGLLLILSNIAVFFIVSQLKNQNNFSSLIRPVSNFSYITPFVIPTIFILTNLVIIGGVYPGIVYSERYYELIDIDVGIFAKQSDKYQQITDMIKGIPRIDVLFISIALGSVTIFLKLVGFGRLIRHLKNNYEYSLVFIVVIFLLVVWSFLLKSGFETSLIRHVLYFAPLFSVILVMGMKIGRESSNYWKLYYYGIIVFMSYYFLKYNLISLNSDSFVGIFIDPYKSPIISFVDLIFAAILVLPLLIHKIWKFYFPGSRQRENRLFPNVLVVTIFFVLLVTQVYTLSSSGANLIPLKGKEHVPPPGWENNIFEVIDYLNNSEQGNVLSVRAPAIPFFTNRTNFDLFNFQTFAYNISDVLSSNTSNLFKKRLLEMGIKYIVLPSERNNLYYAVENLTTRYPILKSLSTDKEFEYARLKHFNIYKYIPNATGSINLIDKNHEWQAFGQTTVVQKPGNLFIAVVTDKQQKIYNRAYLQTVLKLEEKPLVFRLDYEVVAKIGNATYAVEIRDPNTNRIVFNSLLNYTLGSSSSESFLLPKDIVNKPLVFRIYVATEGRGQHVLSVTKASIIYT